MRKLSVHARLALLLALPLTTGLAGQAPSSSTYTQVASAPSVINGQAIDSVAFDAEGRRLYCATNGGLFWLDVDAEKPTWNGPTFRAGIASLKFASGLKRLFFAASQDVGFVDIATLDQPRSFAHIRATSLAYEPQQREVYVASRNNKVLVFNASTLAPSDTVTVPGWQAVLAEAIPGRVFATVPDKPGLFVINALSHKMGPWPVADTITAPADIEVEPSGAHIFVAYEHHIIAIDTSNATIVARIDTPGKSTIAYDPGAGVLLATHTHPDPPPLRISAYRLVGSELQELSTVTSPGEATGRIEPTSHGFVQAAHLSWLLWKAERPS